MCVGHYIVQDNALAVWDNAPVVELDGYWKQGLGLRICSVPIQKVLNLLTGWAMFSTKPSIMLGPCALEGFIWPK